LNGPIRPVLSTWGPLHRSTNGPCSYTDVGGIAEPFDFAFAARSSRISTLYGWPRSAKKALPSSGGSSRRTNGWFAATDSAMRASTAPRSSGVSGRASSKS
jgi:hypothetical protein